MGMNGETNGCENEKEWIESEADYLQTIINYSVDEKKNFI